jgi:hypothetical protein
MVYELNHQLLTCWNYKQLKEKNNNVKTPKQQTLKMSIMKHIKKFIWALNISILIHETLKH